MALTDTRIKSLKPSDKPAKYSDGNGLHLLVTPQGSKLWRWAYRFGGKQKTMALGSYPAVGLSDARTKKDSNRQLLASGVDPSQQAKLDKLKMEAETANTFGTLADEFLLKIEKEGRAKATLNKNHWLISLARPSLENRPITDISAAEILIPLRKIEAKGHYETARRVRAIIGQVFRYAIAVSKASNDPTFGLRGALITPQVTHRPAITDKAEFGHLIRMVWNYHGNIQSITALKLMCLLYPRPGELRQAEWTEFDLDKAIWTIPVVRTKMRREHKKPLSQLAVSVLKELKRHTGNRRLAFPSIQSPERPLSENTLNGALRRMGYTKDQATSHGFRASASTFLNECGKWQADAIEAELAHVSSDEVRRAYHRALYWEERVNMAEWWAEEIQSFMAYGQI